MVFSFADSYHARCKHWSKEQCGVHISNDCFSKWPFGHSGGNFNSSFIVAYILKQWIACASGYIIHTLPENVKVQACGRLWFLKEHKSIQGILTMIQRWCMLLSKITWMWLRLWLLQVRSQSQFVLYKGVTLKSFVNSLLHVMKISNRSYNSAQISCCELYLLK